MEIVLLTKKDVNPLRQVEVGNTTIEVKSAVKYLGVELDNKLNFEEEILRAADKAAVVTASLSKVMVTFMDPGHI